MEGKGKRLRFYTIKYINFSYYSQGYFCLLIDINTGMNRLGNCYASTNYILSIYYSLTKQKTSEAKGLMLMNALGARGSSLTFVQADFLSLVFLNWHTQLNQQRKKRHMILILTRIINHYHFNIFVLQVL